MKIKSSFNIYIFLFYFLNNLTHNKTMGCFRCVYKPQPPRKEPDMSEAINRPPYSSLQNLSDNSQTDMVDNYSRSTIVCVTDQMSCERLIQAGKKVADATHTTFLVINVERSSLEGNSVAIEHLFSVSRAYGAQMSVYYGEDPLAIMGECFVSSKACHVLTGMPQGEDSILHRLWRKYPSINFYTVDFQNRIESVPLAEKMEQ